MRGAQRSPTPSTRTWQDSDLSPGTNHDVVLMFVGGDIWVRESDFVRSR